MKRFTGILLIAISATGFGTLAIFGRFLYTAGLDTLTLLFLRFAFSASVLTVILILRREPLPRGRVLLQLIGMGALGYAGQSFTYLSAIKYTAAGVVALLLYLYPVIVFVLSAIFLHEKVTRIKVGALLLALFGTTLIGITLGTKSTIPNDNPVLGASYAIASALIYSVYIIVGTGVMKRVSAMQSSLVIFTSAALVYGTLTAINGPHFPTTGAGWWSLAGIVILATVIPVATFLAGLERIGPTNASLLSTLEPVVTVLLAAWLFAERLETVTLIGGALILVAVVILTRSELTQR